MLNARRNFWRNAKLARRPLFPHSPGPKVHCKFTKLLPRHGEFPRVPRKFFARMPARTRSLYTRARIAAFLVTQNGTSGMMNRFCVNAKCDCQTLICPNILYLESDARAWPCTRTVYDFGAKPREYAQPDGSLSATNNGRLNKMHGTYNYGYHLFRAGWQRWITTATAI